MSNIIDIKLEGINQGLVFRVFEGTETKQIVCSDCRAWEHFEGANTKNMRHSKSCDFKNAQYKEVKQLETKEEKLNGNFKITAKTTDNEVFDAYQRGYISSDDAMNRDF